ncbi:C40 family peptidase [Anaerostipes sp.]|uniref:C40 family peptidase n=1 Tax=Anaerostipes sp. TaxID=1872530 RepID=UPI0025BD6A18|nr:C40 family peptidase [Anaerostipes sp.]MBS7007793.1 C40 family peptidase [Anaerostipes sp.]
MIIKKMKLSAAVVAMAGMILTSSPVNAAPKETDKPAAETQKKENNQAKSEYANKVVAKVRSSSTLNIRKKPNTDSKILGKMKRGAIGTIVKKGTEWTKVKSGDVTGYVKNDYLVFEDDIQTFAEKNIKKVAKVKTETLRVREKASTDAEVVALVSEDETYKVKKQSGDWAKVKVEGETGYVSKDYVDVNYKFKKAKSMKQIEAERQAKLEAERKASEAQEQKSVQSSQSSSESSSSGTKSTGSSQSRKSVPAAASVSGSSTGKRAANYAQQFVGNPYRYGGNSLTNGIDCSGFTQQIMAKFGYSISRTSSSQASEGVAVSTSNLRAGDLIFYGSGGSINHVAMYIGGGQVVHASNSAPYPKGGIKISNAFYRTPVCARRIIR